MKRLRVRRSDHPVEARPQIEEVGVVLRRRQHPGPHRHGLHELEHGGVGRRDAAVDGEAHLPPVAVDAPDAAVVEGCAGAAAAGLEGDAEEAVLHLSGEEGGGDGELEEEERGGLGVLLDAEAHPPLPVAEERAGDGGAVGVGGGEGVVGGGGEGAARRDHALHKSAEGAAQPYFTAAVDGGGGVDDVEAAAFPPT